MSFKWKKSLFRTDMFSLDPQDIQRCFSSSRVLFFPSPWPLLSNILIFLLHFLFILSSHCLFSLSPQSVSLSADCNRTHRLRPDGDDGQAVPAQAHHCWHQRLCPPHWLRPHQEGAWITLYIQFYLRLGFSIYHPTLGRTQQLCSRIQNPVNLFHSTVTCFP